MHVEIVDTTLNGRSLKHRVHTFDISTRSLIVNPQPSSVYPKFRLECKRRQLCSDPIAAPDTWGLRTSYRDVRAHGLAWKCGAKYLTTAAFGSPLGASAAASCAGTASAGELSADPGLLLYSVRAWHPISPHPCLSGIRIQHPIIYRNIG